MSGGSIRIEPKLDNGKIEGDMKDLENMANNCAKHIKEAFDTISTTKGCEKAIERQVNALEKAKNKAGEYERQLEDINNKMRDMEAKALKNADFGMQGDTPRIVQDRADSALLENTDYQKLVDQSAEIAEKWDTVNSKIEQSQSNIDMLNAKLEQLSQFSAFNDSVSQSMNDDAFLNSIKSAEQYSHKIDEINRKLSIIKFLAKTQSASTGISETELLNQNKQYQDLIHKLELLKKNQDKFSSSVDKSTKSINKTSKASKELGTSVTKSVDRGIRKLGRMALAIFSIRTAYTMASKAANQYLQTNQDMANQVQGIWTTMGNILGPIIDTIVGYISTLISYINSLIRTFTGVDLIAKANASALKNQANATKGVAKATKEANRQLAGFDEMEKLNSNKDASSGGAGGNDLQLFSPQSIDVSGIASKLEKLFEPIKNAWNKYGKCFTDSFKFALNEVWNLIKSIGKSFYEVWTNGTGELTCSLILQILTNVFNIVGNLAKGFSEAWNKAGLGTSIIQRLWNILNNILKVIKSITNFINKIVQKINWTPILQGLDSVLGLLDDLTSAIAKFVDEFLESIINGDWNSAGQAISDAFINIFDNVREWLASIDWFQLGYDIAKFLTDGLMNIIDILLHVDWIGVISSILTLILETVMSFSELLYGLIGGFLTSIWEAVTTALAPERFAEFLQGVVKSIFNAFMNIGQWFYEKFNEAYTFICDIFTPIGSWFEQRKQDVFNAFGSIGQWFNDRFSEAYNSICVTFRDTGLFFSGVYSNIKSAFGNISEWFRLTFSKAWNAVKNVFSSGGKIFDGIKDGILNGLKVVINALISGINRVVSIPFNGINSALKDLRNISIFGISPFGFLGTISVPQIPKLARGGIVNHPTGFIAGEAGKEVVLPLQNNTQWMQELADFINSQRQESGEQVINLYIDGERFFKWIIKKQEQRRFATNG